MAQCAYTDMMFGLLFPQNMALFLLSTRNLAGLFAFLFVSNLLNQGQQSLPSVLYEFKVEFLSVFLKKLQAVVYRATDNEVDERIPGKTEAYFSRVI